MQEIDQEKFGELVDSNKPFVVDFYSPHCPPCRPMGESLERLEGETDVPFYKINVDENSGLCDKLGIEAVPRVLFFRSKEDFDFQRGAAEEGVLREKLRRLK